MPAKKPAARKPAKSQKPTGKRLGARGDLTNPTLADRRSANPARKNETVQQELQRLNRGMAGTGRQYMRSNKTGENFILPFGANRRRLADGLKPYKPTAAARRAANKIAAAKKSAPNPGRRR